MKTWPQMLQNNLFLVLRTPLACSCAAVIQP